MGAARPHVSQEFRLSQTRPVVLAAAMLALAPLPASAEVELRNFQLMANRNDFPHPDTEIGYSACWSYIHPDGREYAVIGVANPLPGTVNGTAIYNVSNPSNPTLVGFIDGPLSIWREMKQYQTWIYVVSEGVGPKEGLQIIRMTDPQHPVLAATYTSTFRTSHTVSVDPARALLICNGTRYFDPNPPPDGRYLAAGMRILSLAQPEAPVELAMWPVGGLPPGQETYYYIHDSVPVGNRLYASSIYPGVQRVLDFANPTAPSEISSWSYFGGFTHNSWPDATGSWLYVTDEVNGESLKVFDISNLAAPKLFHALTCNPQAIVHNAHVKGAELYLSNYTEGIRVLDISDPGHPAEFGHADSYSGQSGGFNGVWEVCPFFPSGTVIASDRQTGLYVYRPVRNYGLVRLSVVTSGSTTGVACRPDGSCCCAPGPCACDHRIAAASAAAAKVRVYRDAQAESVWTTADGVAVFASDPGAHAYRATKFGYVDAIANVTVANGSRDSMTLTLQPKPTGALSGTVRSAATQSVLEDAEVNLAYTPIHLHTDGLGQYSHPAIPEDVYRIEVRRPGFQPQVLLQHAIGPGPTTQNFQLAPARSWDDLEADLGWAVGASGDAASSSGIWTRVEPLGTSSAPASGPAAPARAREPGARPLHEGHGEYDFVPSGPIQPETDRSPGTGTLCFVTGQGTNPNDPGQADVDGGRTTLTSPRLDATGLAIPVIGYWRWFYSSTGEREDWLAVQISNDDGASWVAVDTTRGLHNHWMERAIRVADHVTPTDRMRLRFQAADIFSGTIVEAAVDDITVYDGTIVGLPPGAPPARLAFRAPAPNPASGSVQLTLEVPLAGLVEAEVMDVQGRRVAMLFRGLAPAGTLPLTWDGRDVAGREARAGVYFARARVASAETISRFVRVR
jgi:choice-of-anchor B domain-containing protein